MKAVDLVFLIDETGGTLEASTDLVGNFAAAAAAAAASYSYNLPSNYYDLGKYLRNNCCNLMLSWCGDSYKYVKAFV